MALAYPSLYAFVNKDRPEYYWNYEKYKPHFESPADYEIANKIGKLFFINTVTFNLQIPYGF